MNKARSNPKPVNFFDVHGKKQLTIPSSLTLKELAVMGLKLELKPRDEPQKPNEICTKEADLIANGVVTP